MLCWIRGKYDGGAIPYRCFLVPYRVISDTYGVFVYDPDAALLVAIRRRSTSCSTAGETASWS